MVIEGVIVAAGSGERFGGPVPKAFVELGGVPLVVRAARTAASAGVSRLALAVGRQDLIPTARELLAGLGLGLEQVEVVLGGPTRVDSVRLGLEALAGDPDAIVVVHDAARPLAPIESFQRVIAAVAAGAVGAVTVVPSADTIATVADGRITAVPDRATVARLQTPQAFRRGELRAAHAAAAAAGDTSASDDAGLVLRYVRGAAIVAVAGDERAMKITRPEDLDVAERLLAPR